VSGKVSEAQKRATKIWEEKNKEKTQHDTARRQARRYIRDFATPEDLEEVKVWIEEKEKI
jgi:hypothetical protein